MVSSLRYIILVLCVSTFWRATLAESKRNNVIRVLSYNIHHARGSDGRIDLDRIAKVIVDSKADIVALQEVDNDTARSKQVDQAKQLADLTNMHKAFGKAIDFQGGEYGIAVLSRYPISRITRHRLPGSPEREQRIVLETEIKLPDESIIRFASTHLDHGASPDDRTLQIAKLNQLFEKQDDRVVVAGDLNATSTKPEMKQLWSVWRTASQNNSVATWPASNPIKQIDYVLLRKRDAWHVEDTQSLAEPVASDHAPLLVTLRMVEPNKESQRDLSQISNLQDWSDYRAKVITNMQAIMGDFPKGKDRIPPKMRIIEEQDRETYIQRLITYQSEHGNEVPAYLLIPRLVVEGTEKAHAVLCLHPTDNRHGHKVVVGLGGKPNRQYAQELAERGYVTLAPAYPLLANYQPDLAKLGYVSGTMKAIWDNLRAVDLLESLAFVNRDGVGVIGHSLGGHNAVFTAVFDQRIKVVVSSCGLDKFTDYKDGDIRGWTSDRYMPRLLQFSHSLQVVPFDFHELVAALAPRRCLIVAPLHDSNFQWQSVDRIASAAWPIYELHDQRSNLRVEHPECGHDFPEEMRLLAYEFIDASFGKN